MNSTKRLTLVPKPEKVSTAKKKLDKLFSMYIRLVHSNVDGMSKCYTCDLTMYWRELQCGHFVSRAHLATRFDERNCRPQCVGCNLFGGGKPTIFGLKLEEEEKGLVLNLYREAQKIIKDYPYAAERIKYKELVEKLLDQRGL